MYKLAITGNTPEELKANLQAFIEGFSSDGASAPAETKTDKAPTKRVSVPAPKAKTIDELRDEVRTVWAEKKAAGATGEDLKACLKKAGCAPGVGISALEEKQIAPMIKALNELQAANLED